ncbi:zinc knuckle family protein [Puccinia sorghi]|uniref:Zinc knuckle family protein n=1 Tax=Puccinia sorghi TaxID=27349 RepID=A0A0L6UTJ3_9BASI|nr:zinc knuckle family protein [Puccinia sorghi]
MVGNGHGQFINPNDICHYCRQKGHWKFDFPHKMDYRAQSAPARRVAAADAHGIVDTGATNHVSGNIVLFSDIHPLKQELLLNLASFDGTVATTYTRHWLARHARYKAAVAAVTRLHLWSCIPEF